MGQAQSGAPSGAGGNDDVGYWFGVFGCTSKRSKVSVMNEQHACRAFVHEPPIDLVNKWLRARERGDVQAAGSLCAEDLIFESEHNVMVGREDIVNAINNAASNSGKGKVAKISFAKGGAIVSIML